MPRRRRRGGAAASLFPFLSVLASVIGVLTLLITASAVGQIASDSIDLELYEKLEAEIDHGRQEIARLTALDAEVAALDAQLDAARTLRANRETAPTAASLRAAEQEEAALALDLREAKDEITRLEKDLTAAHEARATLRLQPVGSARDLEPFFVECQRDRIVLYDGPRRERIEVRARRIRTDADYRRFLRGVRQRERARIVFLIRPGGVPVCEIAKLPAYERRMRTSDMPLPNDAPLDFTPFDPSPEDAA